MNKEYYKGNDFGKDHSTTDIYGITVNDPNDKEQQVWVNCIEVYTSEADRNFLVKCLNDREINETQ